MKIWPENEIVDLIKRSDFAVERAILALYNRQTEREKSQEVTIYSNNIGFNAFDAKRGSYYASWLSKGKRLTGAHLGRAREMSIKYRRQLAEIANKNEEKKENG